jgi:hypothetical protein
MVTSFTRRVGTHAFSQTLYKKPPYHAVTEFAPVSLVYHGLFLLLAREWARRHDPAHATIPR